MNARKARHGHGFGVFSRVEMSPKSDGYNDWVRYSCAIVGRGVLFLEQFPSNWWGNFAACTMSSSEGFDGPFLQGGSTSKLKRRLQHGVFGICTQTALFSPNHSP
jgi:hypothetical protein